jgi:hypothetical protein
VEVTGIGPSTSALALMGGRGRPNLMPLSWARFRPSPVQALSLRSNSTKPPSTVSIRRPLGGAAATWPLFARAQPAVKREAKEDWGRQWPRKPR